MNRQLFIAAVTVFALVTAGFDAGAQSVATAPVYVPDYTHAGDPMPDGVLAWDATQKTVEATNEQEMVWFAFAFTNVATKTEVTQTTNVIYATGSTTVTNLGLWARLTGNRYQPVSTVTCHTNIETITNSAVQIPLAILDAVASCGCTQPELPSKPWLLPPGTNSVLRISVNLSGKAGTVFKYVDVKTEKGSKRLDLVINIAPPPPPRQLTEQERAQGVAIAKIDRQAVFKGDCVSCHAKNIQGKFGQDLFAQVCAVCHEASPRATMVPDLHNLKDPTSEEFWRTWITSGKAGTLMPAFSSSQGGPLNDLQIASLAAYLNSIIPPKPAPTATK